MTKYPLPTSYDLNQSPFYKLSSKRKLASLIRVPLKDLEFLANSEGNYNIFKTTSKDDGFSKPRKPRLVQEPKDLLSVVHKNIFKFLSKIKVPDYIHSTIKNRSYISNAKMHIGTIRTIKYDIKSFFPSVKAFQISKFFTEKMLCSSDVSALLTKLCTYNQALPTGSPISPALSFLTFQDLFDELSRLAEANNLTFTLYVDDLIFSGENINNGLTYEVRKIIANHGLTHHERKTRFYRKGEFKLITGILVSQFGIRAANERFKYIRLLEKAILGDNLNNIEKNQLLEKLIGLLGEATQIEPRFRIWLNKYKVQLKNSRITNQFKKPSINSIRRKNKKYKLAKLSTKAYLDTI